MEQGTKTLPRWLIWVAGGLGVACVAAVVVLVVLITGRGEQNRYGGSSPWETTAAEETVPTEEPTEPMLDLPLNPYTEADFDHTGDYISCTAAPYAIGIDVSAWQKEIDWSQVASSGVEFAMIRLAWRGNTKGGIKVDDRAVENYNGAKAAGLKVGGYFFSQATTVNEAVEEAEFALEMMKNWEMDMPIVFDWERSANRTADVDAQMVTDCAIAFCDRLKEEGYDTMVYFNVRQFYNEMYPEELKDYGFWLAMYDAPMKFPYKVDMWQYTAKGSVPGIGTNVDLNILFTE